MSIPQEDLASQQTVWDFDVSTVPGIPNLTLQNSAQFGALRSPRSQQQPNYGQRSQSSSSGQADAKVVWTRTTTVRRASTAVRLTPLAGGSSTSFFNFYFLIFNF